MRLGLYPIALADDSLAAREYGATHIEERHRHRYEVVERVPEAPREERVPRLGRVAREAAGGDRRAPRPPLVRRRPVPSGVPVAPLGAAPSLRRLRRSRPAPREPVRPVVRLLAAIAPWHPNDRPRPLLRRPLTGRPPGGRGDARRPGRPRPDRRRAPARAPRGTLRDPGRGPRPPHRGDPRGDRGGRGSALRLQVLLRQGEPLVRALLPGPRPPGRTAGPSPRARDVRVPRALGRPRARRGAGGGRGPRPRPDPRVPLPPDRPRPRLRPERPPRERQEGPVPRALGHAQRRREAERRRVRGRAPDRARSDLRVQQPGRRLPRVSG